MPKVGTPSSSSSSTEQPAAGKHPTSEGEVEEWWKVPKDEPCIYCKQTDWEQEGFGPRTLLLCSCCHLYSTHVDCYEKATGLKMSKEEVDSDHDWFCSKVGGAVLLRQSSGRDSSGQDSCH
jgi:hypothetical protein